MAEPKRQIHAFVSPQAREGWLRFAEEHGTNVTALIEAVGLWLGESAAAPPKVARDLLAQAQAVASTRSTRRRSE